MPDRVPGIGVAGDDAQHAAASRADQDGRPGGRGPRGRLTASRAWKNSLEVDVFATQQRLDDRHRLLEAADPVIEGIAERVVLRLVPPSAETEDDPTPLMSSIVSVILATRPGLRKPVQATSDPIWMRSVALARPAMMVKHSQTPRSSSSAGTWNWLSGCARNTRWSMIQTASKPASSAVRVMARMSAKWGVPQMRSPRRSAG